MMKFKPYTTFAILSLCAPIAACDDALDESATSQTSATTTASGGDTPATHDLTGALTAGDQGVGQELAGIGDASDPASFGEKCDSEKKTWLYTSMPGNGWKEYSNGKKRVRAWLEGQSCLNLATNSLYVSNELHVEAQKRSFWQWKPQPANSGPSYSTDGHWSYQYKLLHLPDPVAVTHSNDLPLIKATPPTYPSPLHKSGPDFGHLIVNLAPHINGWFWEDPIFFKFSEPVRITDLFLNIWADGQNLSIKHECIPDAVCPANTCGLIPNGCGGGLKCTTCPLPDDPVCGDGLLEDCKGEQCEPAPPCP